MSTVLLVHAPLLGPLGWQPCAVALRAAGHVAVVPDLRACVTTADGWWWRYVAACQLASARADVVVGHSGAGVALPSIAAAVDASAVVFVDAVLPDRVGATMPSDRIREFVAGLPVSAGRLPAWSQWWPAEDVEELVGDAELRSALFAEAPNLPADFYDHAVPVPSGWDDDRDVTYLRFSPAYEAADATARERDWRVLHLPGGHLHMVEQPAAVAAALVGQT